MARPLRLGLIGCGRLAERGYLPALRGLRDHLVLVAVADPDPARRQQIAGAARPDRPSETTQHPSARHLVEEADVDVVLVASPVGEHVRDATTTTSAGIPTLVEKPPGRTAAEAAELLDLRPLPWVGLNRRFDRAARAARAAVPADGEIELRLELAYRRPTWGAHVVADDALLDLGPHLADWARWITGRPVTSVRCPRLRAEHAVVDLELEGGRVRLEAATNRPHEERIDVRDGGGRTLAAHRAGGVLAGLRGRRRAGTTPDRLVTTLSAELAALARSVHGGQEPDLATAVDGVAAMALIDAARTSAARGGSEVAVAVERSR